MVDTIVNGTTHNVKSVFQNGVEYTFPGKTDEEYNELQNRYNQLLEDYNNKGIATSGVTLNNIGVTGYDCSPGTGPVYTFNYNGKLYGLCATDEYNRSSNYYMYGIYTFIKEPGKDFTYKFATGGSSANGNYAYSISRYCRSSFWIKGNTVRAYVYGYYAGTSSSYWMGRLATWNLDTNAITVVDSSSEDTEGWTPITGQNIIARATGNEIDNDGYIYLTLK